MIGGDITIGYFQVPALSIACNRLDWALASYFGTVLAVGLCQGMGRPGTINMAIGWGVGRAQQFDNLQKWMGLLDPFRSDHVIGHTHRLVHRFKTAIGGKFAFTGCKVQAAGAMKADGLAGFLFGA